MIVKSTIRMNFTCRLLLHIIVRKDPKFVQLTKQLTRNHGDEGHN